MAMRVKLILINLLIVSFLSQVSATPKSLELLHSIELNQCLRIEGCDKTKIMQCRALLQNQGFPLCDAEFHKNPKSADSWAACIAKFKTRNMTGREFGYMIHGSTCKEPAKITGAHAKGLPQAAALPQYFTATGLDINNPGLYPSPVTACGAGARKTEEYANKINKDLRLEIKVAGHKQTNGVGGEGEIGYSLMLKKPVHRFGKCYGKKIATYIKNKGRFKKGDQVKNDYGDVLYVVIDCKSIPKPGICD